MHGRARRLTDTEVGEVAEEAAGVSVERAFEIKVMYAAVGGNALGEGSDSTAHARKERENVWIAGAKARGGGCRIEGNSMGSTNIAVHRVTVDKR